MPNCARGYRVRKLGPEEEGPLTTEALVFDRRRKSFTTFYNTCCGFNQIQVNPGQFIDVVGFSGQLLVEGRDRCTGVWQDTTTSAFYSSFNTAVATVGPPAGAVSGVGVGSTTVRSELEWSRPLRIDPSYCISFSIGDDTPTGRFHFQVCPYPDPERACRFKNVNWAESPANRPRQSRAKKEATKPVGQDKPEMTPEERAARIAYLEKLEQRADQILAEFGEGLEKTEIPEAQAEAQEIFKAFKEWYSRIGADSKSDRETRLAQHFKGSQLMLSNQEARHVFKFFWPEHEAPTNLTERERAIAQEVLINAVDGSLFFGGIEGLFKFGFRPVSTPPQLRISLTKLAADEARNWFRYARNKEDVTNAEIYEYIRIFVRLGYNAEYYMIRNRRSNLGGSSP